MALVHWSCGGGQRGIVVCGLLQFRGFVGYDSWCSRLGHLIHVSFMTIFEVIVLLYQASCIYYLMCPCTAWEIISLGV